MNIPFDEELLDIIPYAEPIQFLMKASFKISKKSCHDNESKTNWLCKDVSKSHLIRVILNMSEKPLN